LETADSSTSRVAGAPDELEVAGVQAAPGANALATITANILPSTGGPGMLALCGLLGGLAGAGLAFRRIGRR
jgi:hypothetical protein